MPLHEQPPTPRNEGEEDDRSQHPQHVIPLHPQLTGLGKKLLIFLGHLVEGVDDGRWDVLVLPARARVIVAHPHARIHVLDRYPLPVLVQHLGTVASAHLLVGTVVSFIL